MEVVSSGVGGRPSANAKPANKDFDASIAAAKEIRVMIGSLVTGMNSSNARGPISFIYAG
jgi:hypothetical protein